MVPGAIYNLTITYQDKIQNAVASSSSLSTKGTRIAVGTPPALLTQPYAATVYGNVLLVDFTLPEAAAPGVRQSSMETRSHGARRTGRMRSGGVCEWNTFD